MIFGLRHRLSMIRPYAKQFSIGFAAGTKTQLSATVSLRQMPGIFIILFLKEYGHAILKEDIPTAGCTRLRYHYLAVGLLRILAQQQVLDIKAGQFLLPVGIEKDISVLADEGFSK